MIIGRMYVALMKHGNLSKVRYAHKLITQIKEIGDAAGVEVDVISGAVIMVVPSSPEDEMIVDGMLDDLNIVCQKVDDPADIKWDGQYYWRDEVAYEQNNQL